MNARQRRRYARMFKPGTVVTIPWGYQGRLNSTVSFVKSESATIRGFDRFGNVFTVKTNVRRLKKAPDQRRIGGAVFLNGVFLGTTRGDLTISSNGGKVVSL